MCTYKCNLSLLPFLWCRIDVDSEALEPLNDDAFSECSNLEAEVGLSMQLQLVAMLTFSYIWSIGAFIPFRWAQNYHIVYLVTCQFLNVVF